MDELTIPHTDVPSIEPERLAEVPLQARFLPSLPPSEQDRYRLCRALLAAGGVGAVVRRDIPLAGPGVLEALLARSWEVRFANRREMIRLAEVARDLALRLEPDALGARRVAELQARAWGELGNAYRTAEQLDLAEEAFDQAFQLLSCTADPWLEARLLELHTALLAARGDFARAISRLESIESLYQDLGDCHLAGRALLTRALYTFYGGQAEEALRLTHQGLRLITRERDPELFILGMHNKLLFLVELGLHDRAKRYMAENRRNLLVIDPLKAARLRWVEGRICYGLGEWKNAEAAFHEAKRGLAEAGLRFHGALGALDLAAALMQRGRAPEAEREIAEVRQILLSERVEPELLDPVEFLEDSFRGRRATADLVEATAARLREVELKLGTKPQPS
jgi:tetratricopeptide (TPR) repeat protein